MDISKVLEKLDVISILQIGTIGLGFLLALMAYFLLAKEMSRETERHNILVSVRWFMGFSITLCLIGILSQYITGVQGKKKNSDQADITTINTDDGIQKENNLFPTAIIVDHDEQLSTVKEFIKVAKSELWMSGTHFQITLYNQVDLIADAVLRGVSVKIMMYDPGSSAIGAFSSTLRHSGKGLSTEICAAIENIKFLNERITYKLGLPKNKGLINVGSISAKLFKEIPQGRMYMVDPEVSGIGQVLYIPYLNLQVDTNAPALKFSNISHPGSTYISATKNHWENSIELLEWEKQKLCSKS